MNKKRILFLLVIPILFSFTTYTVNVSAARSMESSENGLNHNSPSHNRSMESSENGLNHNNSNSASNGSEEEYYFDKNCTDLAPALRIGGLVISVVRVAIPTIIIIMGIFSLFSSVLKGDAGDFTKRVIKLAMQVVIAALIFFTPSIINSFVSVMTKDRNSDIDVCRMCLLENNCPVPEEDSWYEYKS